MQSKFLYPDSLKIGYVILAATRKPAIQVFQRKSGYGDSSKWTHIAGILGGLNSVEVAVPKSRVVNLQKEYIDRGIEIKVLRRKGQNEHKRYKIALWWATMNNLPYDILQFFWFPLSIIYAKIGLILHRLFSSNKRFICSELIAAARILIRKTTTFLISHNKMFFLPTLTILLCLKK